MKKILLLLLLLNAIFVCNCVAQEKKSKTIFLESTDENTPRTEPEYKGGIDQFRKYVSHAIKIPEFKTTTSFKVTASYIIEKDGTVSNVTIAEGYNEEFDNQVIQILQQSKQWKPATLNGKPTRVQMSFPLTINVKI